MKCMHVLLLILFSVGMGLGQLLLKYAAVRQINTVKFKVLSRLWGLLLDWPFILGVASYAFLLLFWVWLLTFLPLSRAYPYTLLSLIVTTAGGVLLFQEPISFRFFTGLSVIAVGLLVLGTE